MVDGRRSEPGEPSETEVVVSGIGGQGIQVLAKTLALAATIEGRYAMMSAEYGGEMRGGPSRATVVVGDEPLRALPVLPTSGAALLAHHLHSGPVLERVRPGGIVIVNTALVDVDDLPDHVVVHGLDADRLAAEGGVPQAVGFVLLGFYAALVPVVGRDSLVEAMGRLIPPYRRQRVPENARAIELGADAGVPTAVAR